MILQLIYLTVPSNYIMQKLTLYLNMNRSTMTQSMSNTKVNENNKHIL